MDGWMDGCMYVCMYLLICKYITIMTVYIYIYTHTKRIGACIRTQAHQKGLCTYVHTYIYIYIYVHVHSLFRYMNPMKL